MRTPVLASTTTAAVLLALTLAGCGSSDDGDAAGAQKVTVKAGNTTCDLSSTSFTAGEITLDVENTGSDVTEVYVYGKGDEGKFDQIVGEVENIAPGTSRDFEVKVGGGEYEIACKPGQKGDGIRTEIHVTGAAATHSEAAYDREVEVTATDFAFKGLEGFTAKTGEKIEFKLENDGKASHNLTFFDASGAEIGEVETVAAGKDGEAVVDFDKAGTYTYRCTIGNHAEQGMEGTVTVS
jgi:uncharacterized cupredoxin-like copper-binding protein